MIKETFKVFKITLGQIKKSRWILATIGCILLSFFLVFSVWDSKEKAKKLLFEDPDLIYEQYELVKNEKDNPDPVIQEKLISSRQQVVELETAQKYQIIYEKDERVPTLKNYAELKIEQEDATLEEEKENLEVQLEELEKILASSLQERTMQKIEMHQQKLQDIENRFKEEGYDVNHLPLALDYEKNKEELLIKYYHGFLDEKMDLYHPKYATIERIIDLTNKNSVAYKTEEEFNKDESLYTKYNSYEDYYREWSDERGRYGAELSYLDYYYEDIYTQPSKVEWSQNQTYTVHDGYFTIFEYGMIVTIIFLFSMTTLFYKDYEYNTILQYRVHVSEKAYIRGRFFAILFLLLFFLSIGYFLIPLISYLIYPYPAPHVGNLLFFTNQCSLSQFGPPCTIGYNWFMYALPIFVLQMLLAYLFLSIINIISMMKPPRSILYFVMAIFTFISFFSANIYTSTTSSFLRYLPTTYFNFYELLKMNRIFFPPDIWPYCIELMVIIMILNIIQRKILQKIN